jgi:hypothetical protein
MRAIIAEDGDAVQCVGGNVAAGQRPFAYTVGLDIAFDGGYELALSGLDPETATSVLHSLAAALAERRLKPAEGIEVNDVLSHGRSVGPKNSGSSTPCMAPRRRNDLPNASH